MIARVDLDKKKIFWGTVLMVFGTFLGSYSAGIMDLGFINRINLLTYFIGFVVFFIGEVLWDKSIIKNKGGKDNGRKGN